MKGNLNHGLDFLRREKKDNIILFVHGLIGGRETWIRKDNKKSILQHLLDDDEIVSQYDIGLFDYFTKLTDVTEVPTSILSRLIRRKKRARLNLSVDDLSDLLETEIRVKCKDYQTIVLIAHSMGGLICKNYILDEIKKARALKVKSFFSVAVPHQGAQLANMGSLILNNVQLANLSVLSDLTDQMTRDWLQYSSSIPKTTYFIGKEDRVVTQNSAKAIDPYGESTNYSNDDHSSIICPSSTSSVILKIKNELTKETRKEPTAIKTEGELNLSINFNYDTHFFSVVDTDANLQLLCEEILYKKSRNVQYNIKFNIVQEKEYRDRIARLQTLEDSSENKKIILDTKRYLDFFEDLKVILKFKIDLLLELRSSTLFQSSKLEIYASILMKIVSDHQLNYSGIGAFPNLKWHNKLKFDIYFPLPFDDSEIDFVFPIYLDNDEFDDMLRSNGNGLEKNEFLNTFRFRKANYLVEFVAPDFINQKVISILIHYAYDFDKKFQNVLASERNWKTLDNYYIGLG